MSLGALARLNDSIKIICCAYDHLSLHQAMKIMDHRCVLEVHCMMFPRLQCTSVAVHALRHSLLHPDVTSVGSSHVRVSLMIAVEGGLTPFAHI